MIELNNPYFVCPSNRYPGLFLLDHLVNIENIKQYKGFDFLKVGGLEYQVVLFEHSSLCYLELI